MSTHPENPTPARAQAASETREASQRVRSDAGSALLWATWLALGYADDNCFALCETDEWSHMHAALGLPKESSNSDIEKAVRSGIEAMGYKYAGLRGVWVREPNAKVSHD